MYILLDYVKMFLLLRHCCSLCCEGNASASDAAVAVCDVDTTADAVAACRSHEILVTKYKLTCVLGILAQLSCQNSFKILGFSPILCPILSELQIPAVGGLSVCSK